MMIVVVLVIIVVLVVKVAAVTRFIIYGNLFILLGLHMCLDV